MVVKMPASTELDTVGIRDVWRNNLETEFKKMRQLVTQYCYISMVSLVISRADIGLPVYPRPSILGGKNISFTPVPVITDWNHSGCRHPKGYSTCMCKENMIG